MAKVLTFPDLVKRATGFEPYTYQSELAESGPPEVLEVPTGSGKTVAAVLPWLYRRRFHASGDVRDATPRRLVYVLPMRVLVEQTASSVESWLVKLGLADSVHLHVMMGGEPRRSAWRLNPSHDAIIIGTMDMVLSRALNRGYGESRAVWPIDFGLLNADCHYVYDEVQLMGQGLATSRQLAGLRSKLGVAAPTSSMWMSATVPKERMATVDAHEIAEPRRITNDDRQDPGLARRLKGVRTFTELSIPTPKKYEQVLAGAATSKHRRGTLTIVVVNTVDRARAVHKGVLATKPEAEVVLLHSRFRPSDRAAAVERVLAPIDPNGHGVIVISTQVIEAGVDLDASILITEAAPWPSIVQRAGRCNRSGNLRDATILWTHPPKAAPYEQADVDAAADELRRIEGIQSTPETLGRATVPTSEPIVPVLRRRDLLQLFDTQPDLSGNDVDVSRFIRDADDLTVAVAWRDLPDGPAAREALPGRNERCPAPISQIRSRLRSDGRRSWKWSYLERRWLPCFARDVRPGDAILVDLSFGCYTPEGGWDQSSKTRVDPAAGQSDPNAAEQSEQDDEDSLHRDWVALATHLEEARFFAEELVESLGTPGLHDGAREAVVHAAYLHDLGKAHPAFQGMLRSAASPDEQPPEGLMAKSNGDRGRYDDPTRRFFRHEVASALALTGDWRSLISSLAEPELTAYLVCSHHGKARLGIRSMPDEEPGLVLGVLDGDELPVVPPITDDLGPARLSLGPTSLGGSDSWLQLTTGLRDRCDLGPFRLGFLEALVRLADWQASGAVAPPSNSGQGAS